MPTLRGFVKRTDDHEASPPRQRPFLPDEKAFKRFNDALDKAPEDNPRLRRLLVTKAP